LAVRNIRSDGVISDTFTMIKGDGLVVAVPDGGESYTPGQSVELRWATIGSFPTVDLEWSPDDGASWQTIAAGVANTGTYGWVTPSTSTQEALFRVRAAGGGGGG
jgi:hypothetical protein